MGKEARMKVSVTVDPALLKTVDKYVRLNRGTDRSNIFERALWLWLREQQDMAMPHDSALFAELITTVHSDFLASGPLGPPVPDDILNEVVQAVRRALGEAVLPA